MSLPKYVLVTAAHNEEKLIGMTIECVLAQTVTPECWAIVSDASTDGTDRIIAGFARRCSFIRFYRVDEGHARDLCSRIHAINLGCAELRRYEYDFIGNLDADVSFEPAYFEQLIARFAGRPRLGLAAGIVREVAGPSLEPLPGEMLRTVANAAQIFRRACYDEVGGYPPLPYGGPDTYVEVAARMRGWQVETFSDLVVHHHRRMASAGGLIRGRLRQGYKDYSLGYHPLFEIFKCVRRLRENPVVLGSAARMAGYCWSCVRGDRPAVPDEFVLFLRDEQRRRLRAAIGLAPDSSA